MNDEEVSAVAVKVVASASGRTEHTGVPGVSAQRLLRNFPPLVCYGIPDDEALRAPTQEAEEDTAVAGVEHVPAAVLSSGRSEGCGRDEAGHGVNAFPEMADEAQNAGRAVELAEPAAEAVAGDEPAPGLADEDGADEARRVFRWEPYEDLLHDLLRQRGRTARRRRLHWTGRSDRGGRAAGGAAMSRGRWFGRNPRRRWRRVWLVGELRQGKGSDGKVVVGWSGSTSSTSLSARWGQAAEAGKLA